jgi:ADP-ribose pyrophosphatase YjhB (NUDIX family)
MRDLSRMVAVLRMAERMSHTVSIKGVLIEDGRVVLLENERGEWELPGGRPEPGEGPGECLVREFTEELGAEVTVGPIVDCWNYEVLPGRHVMIVTHRVVRVEPAALRVGDEHRRLGWFALAELDALPLPDGYRRSIRSAATDPTWLGLARELHAIAQTGGHYTQDDFDKQRYARLHGLAVELMALGSGRAVAQIADLFAQDVGYATPRIGARGAVFRDDRILLVRERTDGRWALPGGWCDVNQTARECVEREVWEESGYTARATKLAAVWERGRHGHSPHPFSIYKMFFLCELTGGAPRPSSETSEVGFFAEDELPELSPGRNQPHQVRRMFAHHRRPDLPTEFD